jgi:hypothetical protein
LSRPERRIKPKQAGTTPGGAPQRLRHRNQARRLACCLPDGADKFGRRYLLSISHQKGIEISARTGKPVGDERRQILDAHEGAAIADRGEWKRNAALDGPHQQAEIAPRAGPVDQRRPNDRDLHAGVLSNPF